MAAISNAKQDDLHWVKDRHGFDACSSLKALLPNPYKFLLVIKSEKG